MAERKAEEEAKDPFRVVWGDGRAKDSTPYLKNRLVTLLLEMVIAIEEAQEVCEVSSTWSVVKQRNSLYHDHGSVSLQYSRVHCSTYVYVVSK